MVEEQISAEKAPAPADVPLVKIEGLSKSFEHMGRTLEVLRDINLTIGRGELLSIAHGLALIGESDDIDRWAAVGTSTMEREPISR